MSEVDKQTAMVPVGFEGGSSLVAEASEVGSLSAIAREEAEIKAAIVVAKRFARNELDAYSKLIKSCQRPSFAESARYCFPRGKAMVEGPSVDMAREGARVWGNIRYGMRIVAETTDSVHIKGYALDLEANNYVEAEDKFSKLIQRKDKFGVPQWIQPDERDLRELINRRGAICVRNAILQILPPDIIDDAMKEVKQTIQKAAQGAISQSPDEAVRRMSLAFQAIQVSNDMLERYIGHDLKLINAEELATLRGIYKSIIDGNSRREEHFELAKPVMESNGKSKTETLVNKLTGEITQPPPPVSDLITPEQVKELLAIAKKHKIGREDLKAIVKNEYNVEIEGIEGLSFDCALALIDRFKQLQDEKKERG